LGFCVINLPDEEAWFCRKTSEIVGINLCFTFLHELILNGFPSSMSFQFLSARLGDARRNIFTPTSHSRFSAFPGLQLGDEGRRAPFQALLWSLFPVFFAVFLDQLAQSADLRSREYLVNFRESAVSCVCYHSWRRQTFIAFSCRFSPTVKAQVPSDEFFAGERCLPCGHWFSAVDMHRTATLRERLDYSLNYAALITEQPNAPNLGALENSGEEA